MHYPLTVWAAGVRIPIPDSAALLQYYDAVFSPPLKELIARAELPRGGRPAPAVAVTVSASGAFIQGDAIVIERVVTGVRQRQVVARIVRLETQAPLDARAAEGTRTWIGRIPDSGEYRIDVVRLLRGRAPMPYGLIMRLR